MMGRLPLQGTRVVDLSSVAAGPICCGYLARMGAEVIKVETNRHLDFGRSTYFTEGIPGVNRSGFFNIANIGKKSCTLDITTAKGSELFKALVRISDVVVENFSTGTLEKWGLDYETLRKVKPDLIMASISGFGRTGPEKSYVAYGRNLHGVSGLTALIGYPGDPPRGLTGQWSDTIAAATAVFVILACLHYHRKTGIGQYVDLSMAEMTIVQLCEPILDYVMNSRNWERVANKDRFAAPHNVYRCRGYDQWVAIAVAPEEEWIALCQAMGNPEWTKADNFSDTLSRWQNQEELDKLITTWTLSYTPYEVMEMLQKAGVTAGPCLDTQGLADDPHLKQRNFFVEVDHPEIGKRKALGLPWKLGHVTKANNRHAPLLGEDNDYVFQGLLGLSPTEITRLAEEKVIY